MGIRSIESDGSEPDPHHLRRQIQSAIRPPRAADAAGIWSLVSATPTLDGNSAYAYLLLCTDFSASGAVAEAGDRIVGFALGYRPPARPEACFVWQVAVSEEQRGRGLAAALLESIFRRAAPEGVAFLEATVTPSNAASWSLFRGFARRFGAELREVSILPSHLFPDGGHEEEVLIRIGPLDSGSLGPPRP